MEEKYKLAPGTQVREEDFGLLFYTMAGPRLFFLGSGDLLNESFFNGELTLDEWLARNAADTGTEGRMASLKAGIRQLKEKGVIIEC